MLNQQAIEGIISQGVRVFDLHRSRYIGVNKTHLQHIGIAAAINLVRVVAWREGEVPVSHGLRNEMPFFCREVFSSPFNALAFCSPRDRNSLCVMKVGEL
ncbi:hypothetical protein KSD_17470 [Ktedonobacter sp. SOSP1-85]|uniref:transposase n=1 Tax=Ktedonobacter sp. SOSP1-85 TaxID=2778367 RepID=UPI00191580F9|nr:transposase [Ktedonobacter sp. SOSP1-85]GHO73976.1 hypothetical protein KSD_17470 [Ktedonobacter sp. SOSP1-85]